jgi:serine/threonine protein kinase
MFEREIAIQKLLHHKNIVRLLDDGRIEKKSEYYFVSEFVSDGDIEDLMRREYHGALPVHEACNVVCQILEGLEYTHAKADIVSNMIGFHVDKEKKTSFVHRGIKPSNTLISFGRVRNSTIIAKLSDFGIAKGKCRQHTYDQVWRSQGHCEMADVFISWKKITRGLSRVKRYADDRVPTVEEIRKLVEYPDRRIKAIVYIMASSGIRLGYRTL